MWEGDGGGGGGCGVHVHEACVGGWFLSEFGVSEVRRALIRSDLHDHLKALKKKKSFPSFPGQLG